MTRATNDRPTRRLLTSRSGDEYVVELGSDLITMRPKGSRRGGRLEVTLNPGSIYLPALRSKLDEERRQRRKQRRRR